MGPTVLPTKKRPLLHWQRFSCQYLGFGGKREEEEDYELWPANKSDRSWQSLSNPAKRHTFVSN